MPDIEVFNLHEDYLWKERGRGDYIGRPSPLGNPFVIGRDGKRSAVLEKFRLHLRGIIKKQGKDLTVQEAATWNELLRLRDKAATGQPVSLLCYCKPFDCHGDDIKICLEWMLRKAKLKIQN